MQTLTRNRSIVVSLSFWIMPCAQTWAQAVAKMQQSSYAMIENVLWSVDRKARQERR